MRRSAAALALAALAAGTGVPTVRLRNGVQMPMIAAGSWQYNTSEAYQSIKAALGAGFTMIDTAFDYGNQEGVGRAILESGLERSGVFVETKVPGCMMDKQLLDPRKCGEGTAQLLEHNLKALNLSYVDLVLTHFPPGPTMLLRSCSEWSGTCGMVRSQWRAMEAFYNAGKARAIGVSNFCKSCFECLTASEVFPLVNQVMYHIGMGTDPASVVSLGKEYGVVTQGYSVLGNTPWADHASNKILHGKEVSTIADAHQSSAVQVAMKWVVSQGVPAITKSMNPRHLASDLDLWSWNFSAEELATLNGLTAPGGLPSFACNREDDAASFVV